MPCFVDRCFNKRLVFQWVRFLLRYSPICFYALIRQTSFKLFSIIKKEINPGPFIPLYILCSVTEQFSIRKLCIYPYELEVTIDTQTFASNLHPQLEIENEVKLKNKKLYDKRDDFIFPMVNISASPAYGLYISHRIRYSRVCAQYSVFLQSSVNDVNPTQKSYIFPDKMIYKNNTSSCGWPLRNIHILCFVDLFFPL